MSELSTGLVPSPDTTPLKILDRGQKFSKQQPRIKTKLCNNKIICYKYILYIHIHHLHKIPTHEIAP